MPAQRLQIEALKHGTFSKICFWGARGLPFQSLTEQLGENFFILYSPFYIVSNIIFKILHDVINLPVGRAVTRSSLDWEV